MKESSRGERGVKLAASVGNPNTTMKAFPWKNPFKGGYKDVTVAELTVKGAGLFVGFKVKF